MRQYKRVGKTEYICVSEMRDTSAKCSNSFFRAKKRIGGKTYTVCGSTARAAAKALDIKLIQSGLDPINVLKKVS